MKREHEVRVPASFWLSTHLSFDAKALYNLLLIFVNWSTGLRPSSATSGCSL